jgi:hypothetical protein
VGQVAPSVLHQLGSEDIRTVRTARYTESSSCLDDRQTGRHSSLKTSEWYLLDQAVFFAESL